MKKTTANTSPSPERSTNSSTSRKQRKTGKYSEFISLCDELGKSPGDLAEEIGYDRTSASHWKREGYVPLPLLSAARALSKVKPYDVLLIVGEEAEIASLREIAQRFKVIIK